jgi:hypothetical protein
MTHNRQPKPVQPEKLAKKAARERALREGGPGVWTPPPKVEPDKHKQGGRKAGRAEPDPEE